MTHKFFTTNITGQNFKIQDVVTLAQQIDIPIVAPRYATGRVGSYFLLPRVLGKVRYPFLSVDLQLDSGLSIKLFFYLFNLNSYDSTFVY